MDNLVVCTAEGVDKWRARVESVGITYGISRGFGDITISDTPSFLFLSSSFLLLPSTLLPLTSSLLCLSDLLCEYSRICTVGFFAIEFVCAGGQSPATPSKGQAHNGTLTKRSLRYEQGWQPWHGVQPTDTAQRCSSVRVHHHRGSRGVGGALIGGFLVNSLLSTLRRGQWIAD